MKSSMLCLVLILAAIPVVAACANETADKPDASGTSQPVTLKAVNWFSDEDWAKLYKEPLERKYPSITLERIQVGPDQKALEEEMLKGNVPDIIMGGNPRDLGPYKELDLTADMTDLIRKHRFDLSRFDPNFIQVFRSYSGGKELWALPFMQERYALHYNKDIFDKFGVPYPKDGMSWEEVAQLATQVTGEIDRTFYQGIALPDPIMLLSQTNTLLVDPATDEPLFTKDPAIQEIFEFYRKTLTAVNGMKPLVGDQGRTEFIETQNVAMYPNYFLGVDWTGLLQGEEKTGLSWDMATWPTWKGKAVAPAADGHWVGVSAASKHQDEAFRVIDFWLSNEEVPGKVWYREQMPFTDPKLREQAARHPLLDNKHNDALVKYSPVSDPRTRSAYERYILPQLASDTAEFISSGKDVNTFLREMQEKAAKAIAEAKAGRGEK